MLLAAWYHPIFAILFAFLAILLMAVVLLQRGRGVGLAGAFGGAGVNTAFGAKTGDALTWITVVLTSLFLILAVVMNYIFVPHAAQLAPSTPPPGEETPATTAPAEGAGSSAAPADGSALAGIFEWAGEPIFGEA